MEVISALLLEEVKKHPNGKVDLLGLFEDIHTDVLPVRADPFALFLDLEIGDEDRGKEHTLELRLLDGEARPLLLALEIRFALPAAQTAARSSGQLDLDLSHVTFPRHGVYFLEVVLDGQAKRRVYLSVQPARG